MFRKVSEILVGSKHGQGSEFDDQAGDYDHSEPSSSCITGSGLGNFTDHERRIHSIYGSCQAKSGDEESITFRDGR